MTPTPITIARGDGIGPEIMDATLRILDAAGAELAYEEIQVGAEVYNRGNTTGIPDEAWESIERTGVILKAPITTPQGGGYKSLNVTMRKALGLFANVRPCLSYVPFVQGIADVDLVIVRENEEDLYAGIEHRQTDEVFQCLKLMSVSGTERLVRYGFEFARRHGRRKVTCMTKDNIMKLTDGMFHRVFDEVSAEYPDIECDHMIIDIGTAKVAADPARFDVIVTLNLYGDIISDVAAEVTGSVGLAASANVGERHAMFEAIHGSAPDIAGRDIANPSGLLLAAVQMLVHIGQGEVATKVHNAWLKTIEDGVATADIYDPQTSSCKVGTKAFADAVISRLGLEPERLEKVSYPEQSSPIRVETTKRPVPHKELRGVDVFVASRMSPEDLGHTVEVLGDGVLSLQVITNRGLKVYPGEGHGGFCADHWRCRFEGEVPTQRDVIELLDRFCDSGLEVIKTEMLFTFDGERGYSLAQGQ